MPTQNALNVFVGPRGPAGPTGPAGTVDDTSMNTVISNSSGVTHATIVTLINSAVTALVNGAPGALDTLKELADALGDDANYATTVTTALAGKQPLDADLTSIAALSTTSYGRAFLAIADATAARTYLSLGSASTQAISAFDAAGAAATAQTAAQTFATNAVAAEATARTTAITNAINALVNGAPGALDTLNEIAVQLASDESAAAALTTTVAGKVAKAGDTMTGALNLVTTVPGSTGWAAANAARIDQLTLVPITKFGGHPDSSSPSSVSVPTAFDTAMTTMVPGQALFFPYNPLIVDSSGFCVYWIDRPLEWIIEIPLIAESKYVTIKLKSGSGWGTTYCHAIRNWKHTDYGGAVPTENVNQAPDTDSSTASGLHWNIFALDGLGFPVSLNLQNNVSAVSLVHPHEMSYISITARSLAPGASPTVCYWGMRMLSIFSNSNGMAAGPLYIENCTAYGQGFDHWFYFDGTNGLTQGSTGNFIQDLHITGGCSMPLSTGSKIFPYCIKSPFYVRSVNGLTISATHCEALPPNSPPAAGSGLYPGTSTVVEVGTKIVVVSNDGGANQGKAALMCATTGGTTGGSTPTWVSPSGSNTVTDGSVVWTPVTLGSTNGGNSTNGILDGCTAWPGSSIAVEKGMTISVTGTEGWICTTAGTTTTSQPAFSTAGGRGSFQTDGTATWMYFTDTFDTASVRLRDVAHASFFQTRFAAGADGTNRPLIRQTIDGVAPTQMYVYKIPVILGMQMITGATIVPGLTQSSKDGWFGKIFDFPTATLSYSYVSFDPRYIDKLTPYECEFAHNRNYVATKIAVLGALSQPLDSDLTAIAALATTPFGRSLLTLADSTALGGLLPGGDIVMGPLASDFTVTSQTTFQDVTGMSLAVATGTYAISGYVVYNTNGTPDAKVNINVGTATATGDLVWQNQTTGAITATTNAINQGPSSIGTGQVAGGITTGSTDIALTPRGRLVVTGAGSIKLQFAQSTSDATNTIMRAGAYLVLKKIV